MIAPMAYGTERYNLVVNAFRSHSHAQWSIIPRYTIDATTENRDLRIKFMIGDELTFKKKIQQREKSNQRKNDIRQVVEMYNTILVDIIQSFTASRNIDELIGNLHGLRTHYTDTLNKVQNCYKCAVPDLLTNFNFRV
jgi:hypothetical protein